MTSLSRSEHVFLVVVLTCSFVPTFGGLLRVVELAGGPAIAPFNPRAMAMPAAIVLHVLSSFVFCLVGALQFLPTLRRLRPRGHRMTGLVVALAGCLSAVSGLWMTLVFDFPTELQGLLLYTARIVLGLAMLCLIALGVVAARSGHLRRHQAAMMRAYAIGQGASTQTVLGLLFLVALGQEATGLARDTLMVAAWCLNLAIAQALIRRGQRGTVVAVPRAG